MCVRVYVHIMLLECMYFKHFFAIGMHCKVTAHLVTTSITAPAFARAAGAVCTNCLLRGSTRSGSCVRTVDSDTLVPLRRPLTLPLCRLQGVNAEPMTDLMFSVSHPTEGRRGIVVLMIIDNLPRGVGGWEWGGLCGGKPPRAAAFPLFLAHLLEVLYRVEWRIIYTNSQTFYRKIRCVFAQLYRSTFLPPPLPPNLLSAASLSLK